MAVYVRYNSDNSWLISLPAFSTKPLRGMTEFCLETSLMKLYSFEIFYVEYKFDSFFIDVVLGVAVEFT